MRQVITVFWLLLTGAAFGRFVQQPENAYGDFFFEVSVLQAENDLKTSINTNENWLCNYDGVQDIAVYTYVRQNPWSKFDPYGLEETEAGATVTRKKHHISPVATWDENKFSKDVQSSLDDARIGKDGVPHGAAGHPQYTERVREITKKYVASQGINPSGLTGKEAKKYAEGLVEAIKNTDDPYVKKYNSMVESGKSQAEIKEWSRSYKEGVISGKINDGWRGSAGKIIGRGGAVLKHPVAKVALAGFLWKAGTSQARADGLGETGVKVAGAVEVVSPVGYTDVSKYRKNPVKAYISGMWNMPGLGPGSHLQHIPNYNHSMKLTLHYLGIEEYKP